MVVLGKIVEFIQKRNSLRVISQDNILKSEISKPSALVPGNKNGITFCTKKNSNKIEITGCLAIIASKNLEFQPSKGKAYLIVEDAKSVFIDICNEFFPSRIVPSDIVHPSVIIDSESTIMKNTRIGPYCVIYKSQIGRDCVIYPGVVIYNTKIGNNVIIKSGSVIGYDGFGYYPVESKGIKKFPHYGKVIIEDDVEIGANTTIDRGALTDTIICKGTKIDNLVHIAHGDEIGEQTIIVAGVAIGGSTKVGKETWLGIGAVLKNGINVGEKAFVGMGAVVTQDVSDNKKVIGNLAIDRDIFMKNLKKTLENKQ